MTKNEVLNHWKYFISIEKDLLVLKNFVEMHVDNYGTYSFELSKILQLSCSEIDSVCRILCKCIDSSSDYFDESKFGGNISDYKSILLTKYPKFAEVEVLIPDLGITVKPWEEWITANSPSWWIAYNKVKHYRHSCFEQANLKNTLYAVAALMVLTMYLYREVVGKSKANPNPVPQFFDSEYTNPNLIVTAEKELPDFESNSE